MGVIGGGLLVAVAAALWLAYLMPIWLSRRQYVATERNAVRLQQTLRILAETAETPEPVVIEATARQVAAQQRVLREQERAARLSEQASERLAIAERRAAQTAADAAADLVASVAAPTEPIAVVDAPVRATSLKVLRRRRALCSLALLVGLLTAVAGVVLLGFAPVATAVSVLITGGAVLLAALGALVALARIRVARPAVHVAAPVVSQAFEPVEFAEPDAAPEGWVPQPLPRPLTLSRGTIAATAMASIEAAAELQRLALEAERARRIDELATPMPSIVPAAAAPEPTREEAAPEPVSPYARMGVVGAPQRRFDDLDTVLRRRRQAG
ncbi:hypothetical protein [Agromyces salentinus]|uniref:Large exoprotein n=1 Tax=Agromyces salentinus TaxID=269421 RepID=A0ABN2MSR4_9MICO|nr:hypothetical protein [Agromyces salentinus]